MIGPGSGTGLLVEPSEDIALASFPISQVTILWFSVQLLKDGCAFVFFTSAPIKVVILQMKYHPINSSPEQLLACVRDICSLTKMSTRD